MQDYYRYTPTELKQHAKMPLTIVPDAAAVFDHLAQVMVDTIQANNAAGKRSVLIIPVGPTGQYPFFVRKANATKLDLTHTWFINMDEYLTATNEWLPATAELSFHHFMQATVYDQLDPALVMSPDQRVFPDPHDPAAIGRLIARLGKVDLVIAGLGITGHVAYNDPAPALSNEAFLALPTRILTLNPQSRSTAAINDVHGAVERVPAKAITVGMAEMMQAEHIVLGCFRDFHKGVVRRALCGEPTSAYPVTLMQRHPHIDMVVSAAVADYNGED